MLATMDHDGPMHHDRRPYRICFVCSGNICRSPMAEAVLRELADREGLGGRVVLDSAGTGDWHIGEHADLRAVRALANGGYDGTPHRARQFDARWFAERDLVIALDRGHARALRSWAPDDASRQKVQLLRSFDPAMRDGSAVDGGGLDVPDPYYDGDQAFVDVLRLVETACQGLLDHVRSELGDATAR